ncbi:uncharacterized protein LOC122973937 isoform X2 [Thunnus albacares]|uniref:uncharacterized protein LOC122973937 isoform X2 n=1 Tax=Thunnus albacares TaxID=8236 RepID=UPI001CF6153D|nr:uncharacterized protein LOC122973937 isoform X2 [Thunnus albacares]
MEVETFTKQENDVIRKICEYFSEEAFKYAAVVFTHGDQLPKGMKIEECVSQNNHVRDLVRKCGGWCHVVDNKYWNNNQPNEYRSNRLQVAKLLNTIDKIVLKNNGGCYTNEMLKRVEEEIQQEEERIRLLPENMSEQEIREQARVSVFEKLLIRLAGTATGVVLGALFGVVVMVGLVATVLKESSEPVSVKQAAVKTAKAAGGGIIAGIGGATVAEAVGGAIGGVIGGAAGATAGGVSLCIIPGVFAVAGAVKGGLSGYVAAEGAETPWEAAKRAAAAVKNEAQSCLDKANDVW